MDKEGYWSKEPYKVDLGRDDGQGGDAEGRADRGEGSGAKRRPDPLVSFLVYISCFILVRMQNKKCHQQNKKCHQQNKKCHQQNKKCHQQNKKCHQLFLAALYELQCKAF